jgi:excisionase family DNA binding protein
MARTRSSRFAPELVLTFADAARFCGVSVSTVRRMVSRGEITAYRLDGGRGSRLRFKFNLRQLERLFAKVFVARRSSRS